VGKDFQYKIPIKRNWNKYKNQTILSPYYQVNLGILDIINKIQCCACAFKNSFPGRPYHTQGSRSLSSLWVVSLERQSSQFMAARTSHIVTNVAVATSPALCVSFSMRKKTPFR